MISLRRTVRYLSLCFLILSTTTVSGDDAFHSHDTHRHGYGELGVAFENNDLSISGRFSASDVVGFEHVARSVEELQAVNSLEKTFSDSKNLFAFPPSANCTQKEQKLEHSLRSEADAHEGTEKHKHRDADEHTSHSEIRVEYRLLCSSSDQLRNVHVALFKKFPSIHTIDALIVTSSYQGKQELTPSSPVFRFSE